MNSPLVHIALPVMDESMTMPFFLESLRLQTLQEYRLYICVNQPEIWWSDADQYKICEDNLKLLNYLKSLSDPRIRLIDKCSPGKGWDDRNYGIGWARKTLMDAISKEAAQDDIILSLDADTTFQPTYLETIRENLVLNPKVAAVSVPYYHLLTGNEAIDRAMLHYEIYMRCYAINLWRIKSPYCFTALGSAIALTVRSYQAIGGITPKLSGEDFYFLQKLVKYGTVIHWSKDIVYPAARLSRRVFFGTGPALIRGLQKDWNSYPIYKMAWFDAIRETYRLFPALYEKKLDTPLDPFLSGKQPESPWDRIRINAKSVAQFVRACHEKLDGLRILQYLKECHRQKPYPDESALLEILEYLVKERQEEHMLHFFKGSLSFETSSLDILNEIRDYLSDVEMSYRKAHWTHVSGLNAVYN